MQVFESEEGRFRATVQNHRGEATLSLTFILGPRGRGFTWHVRYKDLFDLRRLLSRASGPLEELHMELEVKRQRPGT